jgi:hypothetical protein
MPDLKAWNQTRIPFYARIKTEITNKSYVLRVPHARRGKKQKEREYQKGKKVSGGATNEHQ